VCGGYGPPVGRLGSNGADGITGAAAGLLEIGLSEISPSVCEPALGFVNPDNHGEEHLAVNVYVVKLGIRNKFGKAA